MAKPEPDPKSSSSGRVTPKGGPQKPAPSKRTSPRATRPVRPPSPEKRIGRRPSSPGFLAVVAVMWLAVGVVIFLSLKSSWKLVPTILAIGIGLLFLRGAGATVLRRERRRSSGE